MESYQIPVNPEYNWDLTPEEQADYINPVELNNKLIEFQNEHARVAQKTQAHQRKRAELRNKLRWAEKRLVKFRSALLRKHPPPAMDRKTNVLLDSYVERVVIDADLSTAWDDAQGEVLKLEDELELLEAEIETGKTTAFMLRDFYENIKTHLAFRKHEHRQSYGVTGA